MSQRQGPRKATGRPRKTATRKTGTPKAKAKAKAKATTRTKSSGQRVSAPRASRAFEGSVIEQFAPRLREDFDRLRQEETRILDGLADPEISRHFLEDPAGALDRMGIEVAPVLRRRLRAQPRPDLVSPRKFRLPNGQVVTPQINVRFTSGKGDSR